EHQGVALGREQQAEQQLDRGGLARTVRPQQAENFTAMNLQVERLQRRLLAASPKVAVDLGELASLDHYIAGHAGPPLSGSEPTTGPNRAGPPECHYAPGTGSVRRF